MAVSRRTAGGGEGVQIVRCERCEHEQEGGRWCGRCGARLAQVAGEREPGSGVEAVVDGRDTSVTAAPVGDETGSDAGRWRRWAAVVAAVALLGVVSALQLGDGSQGPTSSDGSEDLSEAEQPSPSPGASPLFGETTDRTLVMDNGGAGAVALDLDTGATRGVRLPRDDVEEQPFPLLRLGSWLVVTDGTAWAVAPTAEPPEGQNASVRGLGEADYVVPDAEPDRLWLITEPDGPDQRGTWTLVDASGQVIHDTQAVDGLTPLRGVPTIPDGLAVQDENDVISIYDPEQGEPSQLLTGPGEPAAIGDVTRERVASCHLPCEELRVSGRQTGDFVSLRADDVTEYQPDHLWLSGDGSLLAVQATVEVASGDAIDLELHLYDVDTGDVISRHQLRSGGLWGDWYGRQFFYLTGGQDDPGAELGRYVVDQGHERIAFGARDLPHGPVVALPSAAVDLGDGADAARQGTG